MDIAFGPIPSTYFYTFNFNMRLQQLFIPLVYSIALLSVLAWACSESATRGGLVQHLFSRQLLQSSADATIQWTWSWRDIVSVVCVALNSVTAAATGQGGSQILIPIFTALLFFRE